MPANSVKAMDRDHAARLIRALSDKLIYEFPDVARILRGVCGAVQEDQEANLCDHMTEWTSRRAMILAYRIEKMMREADQPDDEGDDEFQIDINN